MDNGPATVLGADLYVAVRDRAYELGMPWYQAKAIAAYVVETYPTYPADRVIDEFYALKSEAWYGQLNPNGRASFWFHYYGSQPVRRPKWS